MSNTTTKSTLSKNNTYKLALTAVMTAVICVLAPFSLPIGVVPISLTNFAIMLGVFVLGWKRGTISTLLYLLIGLIGVPVFSGFSAGPGKLFGPTGGYLIGFIFLAIISGLFIEKFSDKIYMYVLGMILGTIVLYGFGTAWLAYQAHLSYGAALAAGVIPFIIGDAAKIVVVTILGPILRKQLLKAGLL